MGIYRWGFLGSGFGAELMAKGMPYVTNSELYAVGSINFKEAKAFARKHKVKKIYGDPEELINDTNVDIVYIATPHNKHYEHTISSLEKGKHVLCEKPFAVNSEEVKGMIDKTKEKGLFLMEAFWSRFLPNIIKVKEIIESGQIGKVRLIKADFGYNVPFDPEHRQYNKKLIGGSLLDLGIYPLFLSLFLLGKPKTVRALAGIGPTGVDFNCSYTLGYEDETMAVMYSSIVAHTDVTAAIYGERGAITLNKWCFKPVPVRIVSPAGKKRLIAMNIAGNGYNYEANEVIKCLEQGKTQSEIMTWDDSLLLINTLDAIRKEIGLVYEGHDQVS